MHKNKVLGQYMVNTVKHVTCWQYLGSSSPSLTLQEVDCRGWSG